MSVTTRVIKNSSFLIIASLVNNVMTFILTLFTARYLGTYNFGLISSATSLVGVFGIFCDLGLSTYAIREVSRDKSLTSEYFGTVLALRIIFTLITVIVYSVFVILNNTFTPTGKNVMLLFGIYMLFNSFATFYYSVFQSNEKMQYQTIGNVIYSISVLLIILVLIFFKGDVTVVAAGYPIAIFLSFIYSTYITIKHYPRFKINRDINFIKRLFVKGIPFGVTAVFTSIYFWIALILLTFLSGSYAVGLFSSSQKLLLVIAAIYTLFSNAIFPVMSELYSKDHKKLIDLYHKIMKFMFILGVPIALGCSMFSSEIINIIYGSEYVVGSNALTILIWAGVFMFLSGTCSTLLGAINKQWFVTKVASVGAVFSLIVNTIMIYIFSYLGASVTTVMTEFLILVLMLYSLSKTEFKLDLHKSILPVIQIIFANIIMGVGIYLFNQSLLITIPFAIVIYLIALFITGSINKEDRSIIKSFIDDFRNHD